MHDGLRPAARSETLTDTSLFEPAITLLHSDPLIHTRFQPDSLPSRFRTCTTVYYSVKTNLKLRIPIMILLGTQSLRTLVGRRRLVNSESPACTLETRRANKEWVSIPIYVCPGLILLYLYDERYCIFCSDSHDWAIRNRDVALNT